MSTLRRYLSSFCAGRWMLPLGIAAICWASTLPIHLFDLPTRTGVVAVRVYSLYVWVTVVVDDPAGMFSDYSAFLIVAILALATTAHMALSLFAGFLSCGLLEALGMRRGNLPKGDVKLRPVYLFLLFLVLAMITAATVVCMILM